MIADITDRVVGLCDRIIAVPLVELVVVTPIRRIVIVVCTLEDLPIVETLSALARDK